MIRKSMRDDFIKNLRSEVQKYKKLRNADIRTISNFDYKKLQGDWQTVGDDMRSAIKELEEKIEQDGR